MFYYYKFVTEKITIMLIENNWGKFGLKVMNLSA